MNEPATATYLGIDVQVRRPCAWALFDGRLVMRNAGWLPSGPAPVVADALLARLAALGEGPDTVRIGIDAPRQPLPRPRSHYWDGGRQSWRPRRPGDRGWGRHAEVIISASGIARPQWTPIDGSSPAWMRLGHVLFEALAREAYQVDEVFPSAAYTQLADGDHPPLTLRLPGFARGPKDVLDAAVAALVVHEVAQGRGTAVGADGLGAILLPRPLPAGLPPALLQWPGEAFPGNHPATTDVPPPE